MRSFSKALLASALLLPLVGALDNADARKLTAAEVATCSRVLHIDAEQDHPLGMVIGQGEGQCHARTKNGLPVPDPGCTPGATNPSVTLDVLTDPKFKTGCVRDQATSAAQKGKTYGWYSIAKPKNNTGANQKCELDHLISLELGGADTLDNIWPQCGPPGAKGLKRYFIQKDRVENYLAAQVKAGTISLFDAQAGIAQDWTQYLDAVNEWAASKGSGKKKRKRPSG